MTVWNSMVYRLINILINNENFEKEQQIIIRVATFNGYTEKLI